MWLLEVNSNPALQTHCDVLKEVVPVVVKDALRKLQHECQKNLIIKKTHGIQCNTFIQYKNK